MVSHAPTEHQHNWWGVQNCRRCNPASLRADRPVQIYCEDCDGSGWTEWAALATEPWTQILVGQDGGSLWIGGHDYVIGNARDRITKAYPRDHFDVVVSMFHRLGHEPSGKTVHHEFIFNDSSLNPEILLRAGKAALIVADAVVEGKDVLSRCQAGLNRSSLVAGMAMIELGFAGNDVVQLIRARRSPWALCNNDYADLLGDTEAVKSVLGAARLEPRKRK